jgi:hypothetical protein
MRAAAASFLSRALRPSSELKKASQICNLLIDISFC